MRHIARHIDLGTSEYEYRGFHLSPTGNANLGFKWAADCEGVERLQAKTMREIKRQVDLLLDH